MKIEDDGKYLGGEWGELMSGYLESVVSSIERRSQDCVAVWQCLPSFQRPKAVS